MRREDLSNVPLKVCVYKSLEELPDGYSEIFSDSGKRSVFYTSAWFRNYIATISQKDKSLLRIYGVEASNPSQAPIGVLFMRQEITRNEILPSRTLIGLQNYYTSLFGPGFAASRPTAVAAIKALVRAISSEVPRWAIVDLHPMDAQAFEFQALSDSFRATGFIPQPYFCFGNWYLTVNNRPYKEYFETLPSVLKNTVKRKTKKLEKDNQGRIVIVTGGELLEQAIQDYTTVYNVSWKVPEPYPDFIPGLIRTCAQQGWLRLGVAYFENEPVAAQIWIVCGVTASIFKLAYDERFSSLSAGSVLTARLMEHVIDVDRVSEVDYLTGDDPYKKDWMSHRRERWGIVAMNPKTIRGAAAIAKASCGLAVQKAQATIHRWF